MNTRGAVILDRDQIFKKIGYEPHPKQILFHESTARFKTPASGRRFGKSKMSAAEAMSHRKYNLFMPDVRGWIVAPKYKTGEYEFRYLWEFAKNIGVLHHRDTRKAYNVRTGEMFIQFPWGARVDVMSAQHKDSLVGEGLHFAIMSEAAKQDRSTFEKYVAPALTDYKGWAAFPSTPEGFNWYFNLFNLGLRDENGNIIEGADPEYESWNFPSWDNPYIFPGGFDDPEVQRLLQRYTKSGQEDVFWQEFGASFRSAVGLIYPEWDDDIHIIDNYVFRPEWANYLAFDFGFTNPFVCLDIQVDPSDNIYIWRERYVSKMPVHQHAREIMARPNPEGYHIDGAFGDYADPGAIEVISELIMQVYADPDSKDWARGVAEVKRFLLGEDGLPHLFVNRTLCPNTIDEFQNYRMKENAREDQNDAEKARQFKDHALDALRYFIMQLYVLGAGRYSLEDVVAVGYGDRADSRGFFTRGSESAFTLNAGSKW